MQSGKDSTQKDFTKEFFDLLKQADVNIGTNLIGAVDLYFSKRIEENNAQTELGMHIEAIMKHFKGL